MALEIGNTVSYSPPPTVAPRFAVGSTGPDPVQEPYFWDLTKLKNAYLNYLWMKRAEIDEQQDSRRYRHGAQWTAAQIQVFNERKQPVVTFNRIGRKIDALVGLMEKLKQDPKAFPLKPGDELPAELATAVVRSVMQTKLRESLMPLAAENGALDGLGGVEMLFGSDKDISFEWVNPDEFFYDPRSYRHNFQDARYMGVSKWMHNDDLKMLLGQIGKGDEEFKGATAGSPDFTTNPDREKRWFDTDKDFTRVVDLWYKHKGGWCWCLFTGGAKLMEGQGYFYDGPDQICKYIMFSAFIDQDGDRYGFVRNLRSAQDEINQRRSKGLHELHSRRLLAEDGAFSDVEKTRREAVRPDGVIIRNRGFEAEFDDAARQFNVEGQLKFLEDAKNEIENFGPNPALIGQGLEYKSGRAISLLQQSGIAELGPFVINYKNWKLRLYRAIWSAAKRYWTNERWIRVAPFGDAGDEAQFMQINGIQTDPVTGMPQLVNAIGQIDVSFTLDEGPDEVNMMADAYDTLVALSTQGAKIPPDILLELAPLQNSVKKRLLAQYHQGEQQNQQMQQKQFEVQVQAALAQIQKLLSEVQLNQAKAQSEAEGGKHSVMERVIDIQGEREKQGFEREKHQMKMQQEQTKTEAGVVKSIIDARTQQAKSQQDLQINEAKGQQGLRQSEEQHQVGLRRSEEQHGQKIAQMKAQAKAKPKGGGDASKAR
jgi:hypothetical protein